ncbi:MAG TPA: hypothetical protein VJ697_13070 [Nitrososphaeraceae archaeon]|nr:hypothetical protein [Nitrososphaeraceae archaeon]
MNILVCINDNKLVLVTSYKREKKEESWFQLDSPHLSLLTYYEAFYDLAVFLWTNILFYSILFTYVPEYRV